jgi:hypothetical protein
LKSQNAVLEDENRQMRALLLRDGGNNQEMDSKHPGRSFPPQAESYLKKLEENADSAVLFQVNTVYYIFMFDDWRPFAIGIHMISLFLPIAPRSGGEKLFVNCEVIRLLYIGVHIQDSDIVL